MKKLPTKSILIFLLTLSVFLVGVIGYGIYYIANKNRETSGLEATIEADSKNSVLIQSIKSIENKSGNDLESLDNLALSKEDLVSFIENLENTAKSMGLNVKIASVSVEAPKDDSSPSKIHLKIDTSGKWAGTLQFIHALENLPYRAIINSSEISTDKIEVNPEELSNASSTQVKIIWKSSSEIALYSFN